MLVPRTAGRRDKHVGVQFDHMTTHIDGKTFKEFRAVCPVTRMQHACRRCVN